MCTRVHGQTFVATFIYLCSFKLKTLSKAGVSGPTPQDLCVFLPSMLVLPFSKGEKPGFRAPLCLFDQISQVSTFVAFFPSTTWPWLGLWYPASPSHSSQLLPPPSHVQGPAVPLGVHSLCWLPHCRTLSPLLGAMASPPGWMLPTQTDSLVWATPVHT